MARQDSRHVHCCRGVGHILVEDDRIELSTLRCKRSVFPLALIPQNCVGYLSRESSLLNYSQSCPHATWSILFHLIYRMCYPNRQAVTHSDDHGTRQSILLLHVTKTGWRGWDRTNDRLINSQLIYHWSTRQYFTNWWDHRDSNPELTG